MKKLFFIMLLTGAAVSFATTNTVYIDTYRGDEFELQMAPEVGTTNTVQFKLYYDRQALDLTGKTPFVYAARDKSISQKVFTIEGSVSGNTATFLTDSIDISDGNDGWYLRLVFRTGTNPAQYKYYYPTRGRLFVTDNPITQTGDPVLISAHGGYVTASTSSNAVVKGQANDISGGSFSNVASITDTNGKDIVALAVGAVQNGTNYGSVVINPSGGLNLKDDRIIVGNLGTLLGQWAAYDGTNVVPAVSTGLYPLWYTDDRYVEDDATWSAVSGAAIAAVGAEVLVWDDNGLMHYPSLQDAAENALDGAYIKILKSFSVTNNNVCFPQDDITIDGSGIPIDISISTPNYHLGGHGAALIEIEGNNVLVKDLNYLARTLTAWPSNLNVYAFNLDITTNVTLRNCYLQMDCLGDFVDVNGSPKVLVSVAHENLRIEGGAIGGYMASDPSNSITLKLFDTHQATNDVMFVGTRFYNNLEAQYSSKSTSVFNFGTDRGATPSNVVDCAYVGYQFKDTEGRTVPYRVMGLDEVRAIAHVGTASNFDAADCYGEFGYQSAWDAALDNRFSWSKEPVRLDASTVDYVDNYSAWQMERCILYASGANEDYTIYTKTILMQANESAVQGSAWVADVPSDGKRATIRYSGIPFNSPYDYSAFEITINTSGTIATNLHYGNVVLPTDDDLRLAITSTTNITVSAGDLIEIGNADAICDQDQTDATTIYLRQWDSVYSTDPSAGANIVHDGTTYTGAYSGMNMSVGTSKIGLFRSALGWHIMKNAQSASAIVETVARQER